MDGSNEGAAARRYHHGDLRAALLDAAEAELAEAGTEAFSLRKVARRAGVSHAAPAHHFRDVAGLLTALAARGFERLGDMMDAWTDGAGPDARDRLMAVGLAYVAFASAHTALFRLCFGSMVPDHSDAVLKAAGDATFDRLAQGVAAVTGEPAYGPPEAMAATYRLWAGTHGVADLLAARRMTPIADMAPAEREAVVTALLEPLMPIAG